MPHGAARQELALQLATGSRLAWLPEPLILYAGSRFSQATHVELAPGALLGMLDVLVPGRLARGEINQFERYEMRLEVCSPGGACLVAERALLEPQRRDIGSVGVLGRTPVLGSLYVLGDGVDADYWCARVNQYDSHDIASTVLPNHSGLLVRLLGTTPSAVHAQLHSLWSQISIHAEIGDER